MHNLSQSLWIVFNVQSKKNWQIASLVYHTGSETKKKNNDVKIKQTDEHNKSEKQSKSKKAVQA